MHKKSGIALLAGVTALLAAIGFAACEDNVDSHVAKKSLEYTLSEDGTYYAVTGIGTCTSTEIEIDSTYNDLPVTSIGSRAFTRCSSLTEITIPNSVTSIGDYAFWNCNALTNITIPNSTTSIGEGAFEYCSSLTSIAIPNSVTSIGNGAFNECIRLTTVNFDATECVKTGSVYSPIFSNCSELTTIHLGDSVKSIPDYAFYDCGKITEITVPNSLTSIGKSAFEYCSSLASITVEEDNPNYASQSGVLYNKEKTQIVYVPTAIEGPITIPNSLTSIEDHLFSDCSSLTEITIPNSVTSIGERAFERCSSLASISFQGTKDEWNAIEKGEAWNDDTGDYTVQCSNGKLDKNGNEITE